jgi:hypothetical protein
VSIKVYDGHRLKLTTPTTLVEFFVAVRDSVSAEFEDQRDRLLAEVAIEALDDRNRMQHQACVKWSGRTPLDLAERVIQSAHQSARRSIYDLNFSLVILPDASDRDHVLVRYLYDFGRYDQVVTDLVERIDGLEPFPYWNNTDRPDELTEAEWEARRISWSSFGNQSMNATTLGWSAVGSDLDLAFDGSRWSQTRQERWTEILGPDNWYAVNTRYVD